MSYLIYSKLKSFLQSNSLEIESIFNGEDTFSGLGSIKSATDNDLTFFHNNKYLNLLKTTKAKACLIQRKHISYLNHQCFPIIVNDPYLVYASITNLLCPDNISNGQIHKSSLISNTALLSKDVQINSNVIIKDNCIINNNVIIFENSIIGPNVVVGEGTQIMPNCNISNTDLGENCFIQQGAVIGGKGFGFTPDTKIEIRHIGNVVIGNNVDIGSNTTIDRAALDSTIIEDNVRIDNLVQIAHNVIIGKNSILASQIGIAGSTKIGENCIIAGQVGIAGHLFIGNNVKIAAKSGITKNIKDNSVIAGFPATDIKLWKKSIINQRKNLR